MIQINKYVIKNNKSYNTLEQLHFWTLSHMDLGNQCKGPVLECGAKN